MGKAAQAVRQIREDASLGAYLGRMLREISLWLVICLAAFLVLTLLTYSPQDPGWSYSSTSEQIHNAGGRFGAWLADLWFYLFGYLAFLLPVMVVWGPFLVLRPHPDSLPDSLYVLVLRFLGFMITLAAGGALAQWYLPQEGFGFLVGPGPVGPGGVLGRSLMPLVVDALGAGGGSLFLVTLFLIGFTLFTGLSWFTLMDRIGSWILGPVDMFWRTVHYLLTLLERIGGGLLESLARLRGGMHALFRLGAERWASRAARQAPPPPPRQEPTLRVAPETLIPDTPMPEIRIPVANPDLDPERDPAPPAAAPTASVTELKPRLAKRPAPSPKVVAPEPEPEPETEPEPEPEPERAPERAPEPLRDLDPDPTPVPPRDASPDPGLGEPIATEPEPLPAPSAPAPRPVEAPRPVAAKPSLRVVQPEPVDWGVGLGDADPDSPLPPLSLLDPPRHTGGGYSPEALETISRKVELKLADFGVDVEVVAAHPGPVVTLFEMEPAPGTKASKITGLSKDLARALLVTSVRVVEVIPGKSVIGLEVPNERREIVYLSEVLRSQAYEESRSPLTLVLGKDIAGKPVVADLGRMPHALIAGTTGSGKSVAINTMVLSLLYKARPTEVRLLMIDPKMLELSVYQGIPHLLAPVVTDMKEAANALRWCVGEMERRYRLMASLGVRNIKGYNKKIEDAEAAGQPIRDPLFDPQQTFLAPGEDPPALEHLPYIVVIIDELADMMMVVGKKVEELIARLAQKARASGVHLLLATQRPSVDVLTGLIKANIPTRIAFQVSARVDSRTVLDQMGAEHLLGHGDMLYLDPGKSIPQRIHGAFVDDHEVHRVADFLKQQGRPNYINAVLDEPREYLPGIDPEPKDGGGDLEEQDPLFDEAVKIVTESRRASISGVQRRLKIGYNRAARLIEEMERIGIVGPQESNGNREVLVPPPPGD